MNRNIKYVLAGVMTAAVLAASFEVVRTARAARPFYEEHNAIRAQQEAAFKAEAEKKRRAEAHAADIAARFRAPTDGEFRQGRVLYSDGEAVADVELGPLWNVQDPQVTIVNRSNGKVATFSVKDAEKIFEVPR